MKNQLRKALKPLYADLLKNVAHFQYNKAIFCIQWGKNFPKEANNGILFVGRAVNGWDTANNVDEVFEEGSGLFAAENQMRWVADNGELSVSAFWRVIRNVSSHFYPNEWWSHVAWSNICKISPQEKGNPRDPLYYAQLEDCKKILGTEIRILSPKVVVFLTGYWGFEDFLRSLNNEEMPKSIKTEQWGDYECEVYKIGDLLCIRTEHPQGKKEDIHSKCLIKIISQYIN